MLNMNVVGVIVSFLYFYLMLTISHNLKIGHEYSRKFAHIMVGNWYLLCVVLFNKLVYAMIVPTVFTIYGIHSIYSKKKNFITTLLRPNGGSYKGVILFPISLMIILIISNVGYNSFVPGGVAVMSLTYGDSMAAIIGTRFPVFSFKVGTSKRSVAGCLAMFIFSVVAIYLYKTIFCEYYPLNISLTTCIILGFVATLVELFTPSDYDNISVPVLVCLCFFVLNS